MKKGLLILGIGIAIAAVYFIFFNKDESATGAKEEKTQPLAQGKNPDDFNNPMNAMLSGYFDLKNAFVDWDTNRVNIHADTLASLVAAVPFNKMKADTLVIQTAESFAGSMIAELQGLKGESTIEGKRRSFYTLSENLYNLLRTVQYDQQVIYHDKCPMAFNGNEEAYWLSNTSNIVNPYLGNKDPEHGAKMLNCGSIEDSIDFRMKQ